MPPKTAKELLDRGWLENVYLARGKTLSEISQLIGASTSAVSRALRRFNIQTRKPSSKYSQLNDKDWLYDRYVVRNMSTTEIASIIGCNDGAVWYKLKSHGIETRSMSSAQKLRVKNGGYGSGAANWKGGSFIDDSGYVHVRAPDHRLACKNGYVLEHRLIADGAIDGKLHNGDTVHHIDGCKTNNIVDNLVVVSREHHALTHVEVKKLLGEYEKRIRELERALAKYEKRFGQLE